MGPNLLIGFAFAWSLRQPEYVPTLALAVLFLLADLILQRPPGLWASLALLACERLKGRSRGSRERSFVAEWLHVCIMIAGITLVYRAVLIITLLDLPPFGLTVIEAIMTMVFYPVVVAITHGLMGVRKSAPGDSEKIGSRI
ncbi:rod shape-determining protein MreD [Roseobacter sp.]|uniref:rod shape-determining protein MreD n=1 Tax=Roseobacter sp. TaxID=1907202 RepID=UPI0038592012